jgi:hypothetical protein
LTQYYYLASSLPELALDEDFRHHPYPVFRGFVSEELSQTDYAEMGKCFLLNDVHNVSAMLKKATPGEPFLFRNPSLYEMEDLQEGLVDPDLLLPPLADFIWDIRAERRLYPGVQEENELLRRMMEAVCDEDDKSVSGFPRDYLIFEMRLRNLTMALSRRSDNRPFIDELIPFDHFSESLAVSQAADFGLGGDLEGMAVLIDKFISASPLEIEKTITAVRWAWLDETVDYHHFSREAVFATAVKIADVERWITLSPEEGGKQLDILLEQLHQDIRNMTREENSE